MVILLSTYLKRVFVVPFFLALYCVICGFSTDEHKQFTPQSLYGMDFGTEQFNVGTGDILGKRDPWRYAHLLVAADFYQSWGDFRKQIRGSKDIPGNLTYTRHAIDFNLRGPKGDRYLLDLENAIDYVTFTFLDVLANNRDHFQPYCKDRWKNNHQDAINVAKGGNLKEALAQNGFADHFLTDCFAGGHTVNYTDVRNKNLWNITANGRYSVLNEHNRLNKQGPIGQNERGDEWRLFGDDHLRYGPDQLRLIREAVYYSVEDIFLAFNGKKVPMVSSTKKDNGVEIFHKVPIFRSELLIPKVVLKPNAPPIAYSFTLKGPVDKKIRFSFMGIDADNDLPITFVIIKSPAHGAIIAPNGTSSRIYQPKDNFSGSDSVEYAARDHRGLAGKKAVIGFEIFNLPPKASAVSYKTNPEKGFFFTPPVSDERPNELKFLATKTTNKGGVVDITPGSLYQMHYFPPALFVGIDSFEYIVQDSLGQKSQPALVTVQVVLPKHDLIVNKFGAAGSITSNPSGIDCGSVCVTEFAENAVINLRATPAKGSVFLKWDAGCSGIGSCTVAMKTSQTVSAHFGIASTSYTLTVNKNGDGSGSIISSPKGINCGKGDDCTGDFAADGNTQVTLTPSPAKGSVFRGWNGACLGTGPCAIRMYKTQEVAATFATATPSIFLVTNRGDSGAGSLRQAVDNANTNSGDDIIRFKQGLTGTITLTRGQLAITDSLTLVGPGADMLAISGNRASRIFEIDPGTIGTVAISGLTIKHGRDDANGNGGGGIIVNSGTVTISSSALINNSALGGSGSGGAIRKFGPGSLTLSNSSVSGNSALDEFGQGSGGAIRNDQGALTINNSTLSGNSAANGGAITMDDGTLTINGTTVSANSATNGGGGIFNSSGALDRAGEIFIGNSLVAGNKAPTDKEIQNFGTLTSQGHNLFGENGISGVTDGTNLAANDVVLAGLVKKAIGPLVNNGGPTQTHMPVAGGPVVDVGDNDLIPPGITTDQRGLGVFPRIAYGTVDIGAVEAIAPSAATLVVPKGTIKDTTPTYQWYAVVGAAQYYLKVEDSTGTVKIGKWFTAAQAGCIKGTGTCAVTPSTALASGAGKWWIRTRNSTGLGPWSLALGFRIQK